VYVDVFREKNEVIKLFWITPKLFTAFSKRLNSMTITEKRYPANQRRDAAWPGLVVCFLVLVTACFAVYLLLMKTTGSIEKQSPLGNDINTETVEVNDLVQSRRQGITNELSDLSIEVLMQTVDKTLERAKFSGAKPLTGNEDFDRLVHLHNNGRNPEGFWINSQFDCSEFARICIFTLQKNLSDSRIELHYISSRNVLEHGLQLENPAQSPFSHAMVLIRICKFYKVFDPQTDRSSGWNKGEDVDAFKKAANLYVENYVRADVDILNDIECIIEFKIVPHEKYNENPIDLEVYALFLEAVKRGGGDTSLLPSPPTILALKNRSWR
jgi:hypothetical protein